MNILICGNSDFAITMAKNLSFGKNNVTILAKFHKSSLISLQNIDVNIINEDPLSIKYDYFEADFLNVEVLIISTDDDNKNLIISKYFSKLFKIKKSFVKISSEYLQNKDVDFLKDIFCVEEFIITEKDICKEILSRLTQNFIDYIYEFEKSELCVIGIDFSNIKNKEFFLNSFNDADVSKILYQKEDGSENSKEIKYFLLEKSKFQEIIEMTEFQKIKNIVIFGASQIGINLIREIYKQKLMYNIKLIEYNKEEAIKVKEQFPQLEVINGDIFNENIIHNINFSKVDITISLAKNFSLNGLTSIISKIKKTTKTISLMNLSDVTNELIQTGIDVIIDPYLNITKIIRLMFLDFKFIDTCVLENDTYISILEILNDVNIPTSVLNLETECGIKILCISSIKNDELNEYEFNPVKSRILKNNDIIYIMHKKESQINNLKEIFK